MKKTLKMKRRIVSLFGFLSALLLCFFITQNSYAREQLSEEQVKKRLDAFNKYTKTLSIIEQYYVDDENLSDLIDKSISGLLSNLDAHSAFLDEKAFADMKIQTKGEFGGLGITISMKDGALTVIAPIEGTPADKAGIKAGDVIVKIDNQATIDMKLDEAVSKMRGKPGTSVSITVLRKTASKPIEIKLKRDTIKIESVYAKLVEDDDILYLRVTSFDQNVVDMASKYIKQYPKAKGIVLDLRNNPGGLLNQAIGLTNLFVDSGVIVSQKGRIEAENQEFKAIANKKITDAALVVLVNGGSASASEIVSGALQDLKRGIVLGENTFGKGSVQSVIPITEDKEAIKLTIARYYLPSGRTIQAVGVKPDIEVAAGKITVQDDGFGIKESDLNRHLQGELENTNKDKKEEKSDNKNIISKEQINNDAQLKSAIDTVKILNLTRDYK
ncbi:S41 family peptidase [uncultured Campylobacter sp.]|uniref:S41 family peptidase n=1 Tax=uncultured Campylobacter sp. TaxID=218934 RepID=UPI002609C834|nr:S41 family peptidase [uncultured Campylobacter sp.]